MPGLITHRKVFQDSIKLLSTRKKKSYVLKSIETLFSSDEYMKAAMFGVIGPDLFDYLPAFRQKKVYGHPVSFQLHDGGCADFIPSMIRTQLGYSDTNNEWAAFQRAYIYGFVSHYVLDSYLHPFIFCWSGFPDNYTSSEINYYRHQNLLFKYNIDNYYLYFDDKKDELSRSIHDFLPLERKKRGYKINSSVKSLILETLAEIYPDAVDKIFFKKKDNAELHENSCWLDIIPRIMKLCDWMQHTDNPKAVSLIERLRKSRFTKSDYFVRYPEPRKTDRHVLNFHREKWQYPGDTAGFRYDSVDIICENAALKTVEIWEKLEREIYEKNRTDFSNEFLLNMFTGEEKTRYHDMKYKNPVKLGTWY